MTMMSDGRTAAPCLLLLVQQIGSHIHGGGSRRTEVIHLVINA